MDQATTLRRLRELLQELMAAGRTQEAAAVRSALTLLRDTEPRWRPFDDAARRLAAPPHMVERWIERGLLTAERIEGHWVVLASTVITLQLAREALREPDDATDDETDPPEAV